MPKARKSPTKRRSPKRKSPKRKSPAKRRSPKRKSPKRKSPKRKRTTPMLSYKDCVRNAKDVAPVVASQSVIENYFWMDQADFLRMARDESCKDDVFKQKLALAMIKDGNAKKYNVYYV